MGVASEEGPMVVALAAVQLASESQACQVMTLPAAVGVAVLPVAVASDRQAVQSGRQTRSALGAGLKAAIVSAASWKRTMA